LVEVKMAESKQTNFLFFVFIVESPSAPDLYHGRSEGGRVAETLRLDAIPCVTKTTINRDAFTAALRLGLPAEMKQFEDRYPILHISAHGSTEGIQLSSGDVISWMELRQFLAPINQSLHGSLILCMSACKGYSACRMAMQEGEEPHPYFVMIGNFESPTWSDTAVAYLAFYHLLAKGRTIPEAVQAMAYASGDLNWASETAADSKQVYLEFIKDHPTPSAVQQQLETVAEAVSLPAATKALESSIGG
jgi:hypothetical protein